MRTLLVSAAVIAGLSVPAAGSAATYQDQFFGVEVPPVTSTLGTFTGVATGQLPGRWYAQIQHAPLSSATPTVQITGGFFTLDPFDGPTVSGTVVDGSVMVTDPGSGCTNQTFTVDVKLSDGSTFTGTLTHYRTPLFGACITYSASIVGSGTLEA
jgi:hypothetical protein